MINFYLVLYKGGIFNDLRIDNLKKLKDISFDGYAIGGLAVGESQLEMFETLDCLKNYLPKNKPHYLMGTGTPGDILGAVFRGIDMFDCVLPTRFWKNRFSLYLEWKNKFAKCKIC